MAEKQLPNSSTTLPQLEDQLRSYLSRPPFWMRFPAEIDQRYEEQGQRYRLKRHQQVGWVGLLLFNLFAVADYFFLPDTYQQAWQIRLLLVTPPVALLLALLPRPWMSRWRAAALALVQLIVAAGLSGISACAPPLHQEQLYLQWLLLLLTGNLLFRLRFCIAVPTAAGVFLLYSLSVLLFLEQEKAAGVITIAQMGLAAAICLLAMRRMELDSRITYALKTQQKITHHILARTNRKLAEQASRDGLTGLYNRRTLDENLERYGRHARRRRRPLALLFIDVDHFKRYNDTYGHAAGDECLRWLAGILESFAHRPLDFAARFGGEEFVLVLPDTDLPGAAQIAEQLRHFVAAAKRPHSGNLGEIVTISIGVAALSVRNGGNIAQLLEHADQALYQAKIEGRNQVRIAATEND